MPSIRARTIFLGTPDFAVPALAALAEASELLAVVAQPDKPSGRGQQLHAPPTVAWARARGLPVLQPARAGESSFLDALAALRPDLAVVAAYGKLLPPALLALPKRGCVNVHASLLPRYRGAAPVQWAIARGELETGVTLMQMDAGLDTGAMLAKASLAISADDTGGSLTDKLSQLGAALLTAKLPALLAGELPGEPQDPFAATLAPKLTRKEAALAWDRPAAELHNQVRAFQPWPGATLVMGVGPLATVKVSRTAIDPREGASGQVLQADGEGLVVAAGAGALRLLELQASGRRRMPAKDFLAGHHLAVGTRLPS